VDESKSGTSTAPLSVLDGKYQLLRQLGEGGMGAVYEARHSGTGRRCAVKVIAGEALAKSADIVSRFQREAMASGAIESQYIAHVTDTGVDPQSGSPYIVMDLLLGEDVDQAVRRLGPLPPEVALRVAAQACLGLQKAHEAGVVHRDIKPANIFLARRDGGEVLAKLLDFGIAKVKADPFASAEPKSLTRSGSLLGSPLYMSPEQALGQKDLDHRTDLWSLGVVMYEALTGSTPHASADTLGVIIMKICGEPSPALQDRAPWVTPEVAAIVHRALELDPAARWASAAEMFAAIRALLPGGYALDESMFVPLSPAARGAAAPRFSSPADLWTHSGQTSAVRASRPDADALVTAMGGTLGGEAVSRVPRSRPVMTVVLAGLAGLAVLAALAFWLSSQTRPTAAAAGFVESQPALPPGPTAPPPAVDRTGRLVVSPANVHAEVDSRETLTTNGTVPIVGPLGSTHRVRLYADGGEGREKLAEVVMGEDGVVPAMLDLGPAPAPSAPAPAKPTVAATPRPRSGGESKKNPLQMDVK
jgi:serine/threonine-protein kinase